MNALVTAIADLVKTFCSGVVSLVTVPAQTLYASFGSFVFALPLFFVAGFVICKYALQRKENARQKLLNNNKKEDLK